MSATLSNRALVHYRLGEFDEAVGESSASLAGEAQSAPALYISGLAKRHLGDGRGGDADIAAAEAIDPLIARRYAGFGVS